MSTTAKVITFGAITGLIWSVISGILNDLFQSDIESVEVIIAGLLTGIIVSLAFKSPLQKFGNGKTLITGLLSLPFGAFVFGFIFSVLHPSGSYIDSQLGISNALQVAVEYATLSLLPFFAIFLLPLSVLTTFVLRHVIHSRSKSAN
jgi:hypothetical protein